MTHDIYAYACARARVVQLDDHEWIELYIYDDIDVLTYSLTLALLQLIHSHSLN